MGWYVSDGEDRSLLVVGDGDDERYHDTTGSEIKQQHGLTSAQIVWSTGQRGQTTCQMRQSFLPPRGTD